MAAQCGAAVVIFMVYLASYISPGAASDADPNARRILQRSGDTVQSVRTVPTFATRVQMVGGPGEEHLVEDHMNGGVLQSISVLAGPRAILQVNVTITTGVSATFGAWPPAPPQPHIAPAPAPASTLTHDSVYFPSLIDEPGSPTGPGCIFQSTTRCAFDPHVRWSSRHWGAFAGRGSEAQADGIPDVRTTESSAAPGSPRTFAFAPGETIEVMTLWDNGMAGVEQALGGIQFVTNWGRNFTAEMTHGTGGVKAVLEGPAVGSGLVVGVAGGGEAAVVSIGFQFLKCVDRVSVDVDGYPGIERVLAVGRPARVVARAVYGNPTDSTQDVVFSGAANLVLESNWTTELGYLGKKIGVISAQTPYVDATARGKFRWRLDGWQTLPLRNRVSKTPSYNLSVAVAAGSRTLVNLLAIEYGIRIRYVGTAIVKTGGGGLWMFPTHGVYSGTVRGLREESSAVV